MATTDTKEEEGARSFARFIESVGDGDLHHELSDDLHDLIQACEADAARRESSSEGTITIKLKLKVDHRGVAAIAHDVVTKMPKSKRTPAVMYVTPGGNLTRENPKQQSLPLRDVNKPREVRDAAQ